MNNLERQYAIANTLPTAARNLMIVVFAVVGFTLQTYVNVAYGLIGLFLAMLLSLTRGVKAQPKFSKEQPEWKTVTVEEFKKLGDFLKAADKFRSHSSGFTLKSVKGCGGCLLFLLAVFVVMGLLYSQNNTGVDPYSPIARGGNLSLVFTVDAILLIAPLWLWGSIQTWEPPNMRHRLNQLSYIYSQVNKNTELDITPNLLIQKADKGDVPIEVKLTVNFKDAPSEFMGIQVQTSLNNVQNKIYPYTYCVLVAKPEIGLADKVNGIIEHPPKGGFKTPFNATENEKKEAKFARFQNSLVEVKKQDDVEITVVRQNTRRAGYMTQPKDALVVFNTALTLAKRILNL